MTMLQCVSPLALTTIVKDLRSNESCDHYHDDSNLVPNPGNYFSFETAFQI